MRSYAGSNLNSYRSSVMLPYNQWLFVEAWVSNTSKEYGLKLWDSAGHLLADSYSDNQETHLQLIGTISATKKLYFASNFNGIVRSILYSTDLSATPLAEPVVHENGFIIEQPEYSVLVYFSFTKSFYESGKGLINMARKVSNGRFSPVEYLAVDESEILYTNAIWRDPGEDYQLGNYDGTRIYDGITCN